MADDRNNPNQSGNQNQQAPGRNPDDNQRTAERGEPGKDQGLGKGQEGNRDLNEGGFEKGGQGRETT